MFWGSTLAALRTHPQLLEANVVVDFWGYETTLRSEGRFSRLKQLLKGRTRLQTLQQLGDHLWFVLGERHESFEAIRLVGHSMGGLVIAAAMRHVGDHRLAAQAAKIEGVAFCCTPLCGANLTDRAHLFFKIFGSNVHIDDLRPDSRSRKAIVNTFANAYLGSPRSNFAVFRASGDEVVAESELLEAIPDLYRPSLQVLDGSHSGCLKDLQVKSENVARIVRWLTADFKSAPTIVREHSMPSVEFRQDLIWFLLRGVRDTFRRTVNGYAGAVPEVRLNIMLFDKVAETLKISYCDYNDHYSEAEKRNQWAPHQGACGVAWATQQRYLYASDSTDPAHRRQPMPGQDGSVGELDSVLSIPIWHNEECRGVLNVDSRSGVASTKLDTDYADRIFHDAAKCIAWALSD
jgi:pimeloyl-ACP methyl ester carboxylesterase